MWAVSQYGFRLPRLLVALAVLAGFLAVAPPTAFAAGSSVVTTCGDNTSDPPPGSLRAAVQAANADGAATADEPHVISFALSSPCDTIALGGQELAITGHVDIQGPGASALTVSASNASRVFAIAEGATAIISGLTIADGVAPGTVAEGGNIRNRGNLTVRAVVITRGLSDFGGAIDTDIGTLTVDSSTLTGNNARTNGAAIWSGDTTTIVNSTISGNTSPVAAILAQYDNHTVAIINSTVANNTSTSAGAGSSNLRAINTARFTLSGTIVSGSNGHDNCSAGADAAIVSLGHNLEDDDTCGLDDGLGDIRNGTPDLLDLTDNGGPTPTHALGLLSDALNHIPQADCAVATDQRGYPRPSGGLCDIGAFELVIPTTFQACLYAGALTQVRDIGDGAPPPVSCGRGVEVELLAAGDPQFGALHACLYAGSLSQVGTEPPANCGRGTPVALAIGDTLYGCLYAGQLSQLGFSQPASCGRGEHVGLARAVN